jgi:hypothetical protein
VAKRTDDVPRWARPFVAAFLAAFLVVGLLGVDAWPLTGWRLFSHLRSSHQTTWDATTVDAAGAEHPVRFARFPQAMRGFSLLAARLPRLSPSRRAAVCAAWAAAVHEGDRTVRLFRVWRVERDLSRRAGERAAAPISRTVEYACSPPGGL